MYKFGESAGIAFQIKDDLFDYTQNPIIGKPTGIDIREKKITLPFIYTLNNVDKKTKKYLINIIKNNHKDDKKILEAINIVKRNNGLLYAKKVMKKYHSRALKILNSFPDDNTAKESLSLLLNYIINRKK